MKKLSTIFIVGCALIFGTLTAGASDGFRLEIGSKVYIESMDGFEVYLAAAIEKKKVPVRLVSEKSEAEFVVSGTSESQKASWAKMLVMGSTQSSEEASIVMKDARSGTIVFAYAVNKRNSVHGKQSTSEACAKHLKAYIQGD
jgi:hypothetical protein